MINETIWVCSGCGSDSIREAIWVSYNTKKPINVETYDSPESNPSVFNKVWCDDCDCDVEIEVKL